ncbi:MAG: hypothetical protein OHK0015_31330 [Chloroflexi bacterium OHK40]
MREVYGHTRDGGPSGLRTLLRAFCDGHQAYLAVYKAIRTAKRINP